jgi:protein-S-isoprenylcysteine O-methyltransferase Ste14
VDSTIIARVLFVVWIVDETYWMRRQQIHAQRGAGSLPRPIWLLSLALLAPLVVRYPDTLPAWLGWLGIGVQGTGLLLMMTARRRLAQAHSFSWGADGATDLVTDGPYRLFEHPIYTGMQLTLWGWAMVFPSPLIAAFLLYRDHRRCAAAERQHLATAMEQQHRGIDSWMW